jgi:uncharacterized protein
MIAIVSPAKKLIEGGAELAIEHSTPPLLNRTEELAQTTRLLSREDLQSLMNISDKLADLNWQRFQSFGVPFTAQNARQAVLCFNGDTYMGIDAHSLSNTDLHYAQNHLAILSGFYGVLRPLDLIQPYRLEMGTRLETSQGKNLYAFWGSTITEQINQWTRDHTHPTVINLASNEYYKSVKHKQLRGGVITPVFKEEKNGKSRVISFMAKKARGMMARYIIQNKLEEPEALKEFQVAGYAYQPKESTAEKWVFSRMQPPPLR